MTEATVFHSLAKDLYGRLGIDFDNRDSDKVFVDVAKDVEDKFDISSETSTEKINGLTEELISFSAAEIINLSKPEEYKVEIDRLAALDNPNPEDDYGVDSPIKDDVAVLEQIFTLTASLHNKLEDITETLESTDHDSANFKDFADLKDQLIVAVTNLRDYILKPVINKLQNLFNETDYRGELKSVLNNLYANMTDSFNKFLGTEDIDYID